MFIKKDKKKHLLNTNGDSNALYHGQGEPVKKKINNSYITIKSKTL